MNKYLVFLLLVLPAFAQNSRYDSVALGPRGPIPFAAVAVCTQPANTTTSPCSPLANLCSSLSDAACTSPNPVTADSLGNYHFYGKPTQGPFTIQLYGPQVAAPVAISDQTLGGSGSSIAVNSLNGVVYATTSLQAAYAQLPANGGVIYVPPAGITLSSSATFSKTVLIRCDKRSTITYGSNSYQIIFNGNGSGMDGCGLVGTGVANPGSPPVVSTGDFFTFTDNSISLFGSTGGSGELSITKGSNIQVQNNIFNQNQDYDIAILDATASQVMFTFVVSGNILSDLKIANTGTSASLAALNINNNSFAEGEGTPAKTNPCISLSSTGTNVADVVISSNNCVPSQAGPTVGYSIANSTTGVFTGNTWDASGISSPTTGLLFTAVNNYNIAGNSISNSGLGTAIGLTGTCTQTYVGGNTILSAVTGVSVGASCTNITLGQEKLSSVGTSYTDSGTGTSVLGTIASGTATMTTAAITAGNCGTTVTVAATGVLTTDKITWSFNAAPAGSNAGLVAWPTANNVNFAYCPNSAETPAAATINWGVTR